MIKVKSFGVRLGILGFGIIHKKVGPFKVGNAASGSESLWLGEIAELGVYRTKPGVRTCLLMFRNRILILEFWIRP